MSKSCVTNKTVALEDSGCIRQVLMRYGLPGSDTEHGSVQ